MDWNPDPDIRAEQIRLEYIRRSNLIRRADEKELWPYLEAFYKDHPIEFIEDFCITYDPRNASPIPKLMPFKLFPRQKEAVECIVECYFTKENALYEKCRDAGLTWIACGVSVWLWRFHAGASVGWGSRKADLVDKKANPDSIFEKIRMIIKHLPKGLLPKYFDIDRHCTMMNIVNPENGSTISGESGDSIGRGGRKSIYFKDEAAHYENPESIEAALGDNTDVQIDISSVNGTNNVFYKRRMSGELWHKGHKIKKGITRVFVFDWKDHPYKTQEWYDRRRSKAESEGLLHIFAQEVDRDYAGSVEGVVIPQKWVKAAVDAHIRLGIEIEGSKVSGLDVADEGGDKNAQAFFHGILLQWADAWGEGDTGETARRAVLNARAFGVNELYYDCIGVGAGVKADTNRMKASDQIPDSLMIFPWDASSKPLNPTHHIIPDDPQSPLNIDYYSNLKAQGWFLLRMRFKKTYEAITKGIKYPPEELISISSDIECLEQLMLELSQATYSPSISTGKVLINKKPKGGKSPNIADAVVIASLPTRPISILDVL